MADPIAAAIAFPALDPIILQIGPFAIRWYALAYVTGLLAGWRYGLLLARREPRWFDPARLDDLLVWVTLGVVLGGRLGYVLFYKPAYFAANPLEILMVWHGGMAFHGGMLGVVVAVVVFARKVGAPILAVGDLGAAAAPIGLFFGRIANFVNQELYGRVTEVPWAVIFPHGGPLPRHPSQLYEALLEGLLLFAVLAWLSLGTGARRRPGIVFGSFLAGYGLCRSVGELFREPDAHLGFIFGPLTMGQLLSFPMILAGLAIILYARRRPAVGNG